MGLTDGLKKKAEDKANSAADAAPTPVQSDGPVGGERNDPRGEGTKDKDVASGVKSFSERQKVAEEKVAAAKAGDQEDTREETSGDERHDLVSGKELNIPPSIVQERLRNGQNPSTGEPWTREDRMAYDRSVEQARQIHAKAVRESEERMRREATEANTPIQPTPHVPTSFLTQGQKEAMQKAQDEGKGAVAQARARDANDPDALGRAEAERDMAEQEKKDLASGVDSEVEQSELDKNDADTVAGEDGQDADEVQKDLDKEQEGSSR